MASPGRRDDDDYDVLKELLEGYEHFLTDHEPFQEGVTSATSETSPGEPTGRTTEAAAVPGKPQNENSGNTPPGLESGSASSAPPGPGLIVPAAGTRGSRRKSKPKKLIVPEEEDGGSPLDDLKEDDEDPLFFSAQPEMATITGVDAADGSQNSGTIFSDSPAPSKSRRARKKKPPATFKNPYLVRETGEDPSLMFIVPTEEMETLVNTVKRRKRQKEVELQEMHWCDVCDDCFPTLGDLEMHQTTHNDEPEEDFNCEECGRVFDSASKLEEHQSKKHGKLRYRCDICGIQYNYQSQFLIHMRAHSGERQFTCDECGKEFKHRCSLVIHRRRHAGATPHQCQKCGKMLDTRSVLLKHEKMRYCPDCNKCYTQRGFPKHLIKNCVKS